tara:strand:- start:332 stop:436 length:105 start_codon:yes stop_codon:yes gene_type:complete
VAVAVVDKVIMDLLVEMVAAVLIMVQVAQEIHLL